MLFCTGGKKAEIIQYKYCNQMLECLGKKGNNLLREVQQLPYGNKYKAEENNSP